MKSNLVLNQEHSYLLIYFLNFKTAKLLVNNLETYCFSFDGKTSPAFLFYVSMINEIATILCFFDINLGSNFIVCNIRSKTHSLWTSKSQYGHIIFSNVFVAFSLFFIVFYVVFNKEILHDTLLWQVFIQLIGKRGKVPKWRLFKKSGQSKNKTFRFAKGSSHMFKHKGESENL